jgi:hypothetical protein
MALLDRDTLQQDIAMNAIMQFDLAEQDAAIATALVEAATTVLVNYRTAVSGINANDALSPIGKTAQIATAADAAQRDLQATAGGQLSGIAASITRLEAILNPPVTPADDMSTTMLLVERRNVLRAIGDPLVIEVILIDAASSGDTLTMRAILEAAPFETRRIVSNDPDAPPPPFAIDPQAVLGAKQIAAERAAPEVAASLKALRSAYATLQALIGDATREIGGMSVDPLYAQAGLKPNAGNGAGATA